MPYDNDPYRRSSRQYDESRSGNSYRNSYDSSRYGSGYGSADRRNRTSQRSRSSRSGGSYRNGSYGRSSNSRSRTQDRSSRNRSQQRDHSGEGQRRRSRNLTMPDTGYSLHSRRVRGSNGSLSHRLGMFDGRVVVLAVILILVVVVLVINISSCVRNANSSSTEETKQMSTADSRVAAGVSDSMVSEFSTQLDRNEKLAQIAANADQYDDDRLLQLALDEPAAISFVAGYPTAEKTTSGFNQTVSIGNPPLLYDWNTAWGYAEYGDGCIAVTGSEPTTLSMAYMGLTGNTDQTPVGTARALNSAASSSTSSGSTSSSDSSDSTNSSSTTTSTSGTGTTSSSSSSSTVSADATTFCTAAQNLGLTPTVLSVSTSSATDDTSETTTAATTGSETLTAALKQGALVAVKLKSQTLTDSEHWALVVNANADGSVSVYDPTSSSVSSHTWGAGTVASSASEMISLVASKSEQNNATDDTGTSSTGSDTTSSTGSSATSNSSATGTNASTTGNGSSASGTSSSTSTGSSNSSTSGSSTNSSTTSSGSSNG